MTDPKTLTFALPGDITTLTGGYIYDRRMVQGLRDQGRHVDVLALPDSFPTPSDSDMRQALFFTSVFHTKSQVESLELWLKNF